jgi:hypothetical protein
MIASFGKLMKRFFKNEYASFKIKTVTINKYISVAMVNTQPGIYKHKISINKPIKIPWAF